MDELQKLYDAVSAEFNVGSFEEFSSRMATSEDRKKFYNAVSAEGFDLGDYDTYESRLGGSDESKKKDFTDLLGKDSEDIYAENSDVTPKAPEPSEISTREDEPFDPAGSGYDYATAKAKGLGPDETGHWPSLDPETGMLLKGYSHPTIEQSVKAETSLGNAIYPGEDGRYYSRPMDQGKVNKELAEVGTLQLNPDRYNLNEDGDSDFASTIKASVAGAVNVIASIPAHALKHIMPMILSEEDLRNFNKLPMETRDAVLSEAFVGAPYDAIKVQNFLTDREEELRDNMTQYETTISEDLWNKDFGQALDRLKNEAAGSLIQTIPALIPVVGLPLLGAGTASAKQEQLERSGEGITGRTLINSDITGAAEGIFEKYTLGLMKGFSKAIGREGVEGMARSLGDVVKKTAESMGLEGLSEFGTQLTENLADKLVMGYDISAKDFWLTIADATLIGGFSGAGMGGSTAMINYAAYRGMSQDEKRYTNKTIDQISELRDLQTKKNRPEIDAQIKGLEKELSDFRDSKWIKVEGLEYEDKVKLVELDRKIDEKKRVQEEEGLSIDLIDKLAKDVAEIEKEKEAILEKGKPVEEVKEEMAPDFGVLENEKTVEDQKKTEEVDVPVDRPGTMLNVGLVRGKTNETITEEQVMELLPEDVEVVKSTTVTEDSGLVEEPTLSIELSRPLTDEEMFTLRKGTDQLAIPQYSDGKGVMYGTLDWGPFNGEFFITPEGTRLTGKTGAINPETSDNFANLTTDKDNNLVFFHVSPVETETLDPAKYGTNKKRATSLEEASAMGKVGGVTMFYTKDSDGEAVVTGDYKYAVSIDPNKVYDFNEDPNNYIEEARKRHEAEHPGKAFDANTQVAYVTKIANENGFDIVVSRWNNKTRAHTTKKLKVTDVRKSSGNIVKKPFSQKYESNESKGYVPVKGVSMADRLNDLYLQINKERNKNDVYDDLYHLYHENSEYSQDEIGKMINDSNLPDSIKDEYNKIIKEGDTKGKSIKQKTEVKQDTQTAQEQQEQATEEKKEEEVVKDKDGKPKVFYHGTSKSSKDAIEKDGFDAEKSNQSISFSTSEKGASSYNKGGLVKVNLAIKNPMSLDKNFEIREKIVKDITGKSMGELTAVEWKKHTPEINKRFQEEAKRLGYDAVYEENGPEVTVIDPKIIRVIKEEVRVKKQWIDVEKRKPGLYYDNVGNVYLERQGDKWVSRDEVEGNVINEAKTLKELKEEVKLRNQESGRFKEITNEEVSIKDQLDGLGKSGIANFGEYTVRKTTTKDVKTGVERVFWSVEIPDNRTADGRNLLSYESQEQVEKYLNKKLNKSEASKKQTIDDVDSLLKPVQKEYKSCKFGDCIPATKKAAKILDKNGIPFKIYEGWVEVNDKHKESGNNKIVQHTWIKLDNGKIIDLTKSQFNNQGGIKSYLDESNTNKNDELFPKIESYEEYLKSTKKQTGEVRQPDTKKDTEAKKVPETKKQDGGGVKEAVKTSERTAPKQEKGKLTVDEEIDKIRGKFEKVEKEGREPIRERDFEGDWLVRRVNQARAQMYKYFPDVKFVIYDNYRIKEKGSYYPRSKTIYLNMAYADARTVPHEMLHAALIESFGSNKEIDEAAKNMFSSIAKKLKKTDPKISAELEDFVSSYREGVRNEERLAEIAGMLSDGTLNRNTIRGKEIIRQVKLFLAKVKEILAKTVGLYSPTKISDAEAIDFLDRIAFGKTIKHLNKSKAKVSNGNLDIEMRKQAEKIFLDQNTQRIGSTSSVAKFLDSWKDKNKIFNEKISEVSDNEFVSTLANHVHEEIKAWSVMRSNDYISFYDTDISERANPMLQEYAKKNYGRALTDSEVKLFHLVSSLASPSNSPYNDSWKGFWIFDRYMRTGELSGFSEKLATEWEWVTKIGKNGKEKRVRVDTGVIALDYKGETYMSKVTPAYAQGTLYKFVHILDKLNGDLDAAIEWVSSHHTFKEINDMLSDFKVLDHKGKAINANVTENEYISEKEGGFGVFGITGAKLGSYILNRFGNFSTVTKDLWYARSMARLTGEPLFKKGEEGKIEAIKVPWPENTKEGRRKRSLADKAFAEVGNRIGVPPAMIQEMLWDFEKRLWEGFGAAEDASYISDGLAKGIKEADKIDNRRQKIQVEKVIAALREDGFSDEAIKGFLKSDFGMTDEEIDQALTFDPTVEEEVEVSDMVKTVDETFKEKSGTDKWATSSRTMLQDYFIRVKRLQNRMRKAGIKITPEMDLYIKETLLKGRALHKIALAKKLIIDVSNPNSLVRQAQKAGITFRRLGEFMTARHAIERNQNALKNLYHFQSVIANKDVVAKELAKEKAKKTKDKDKIKMLSFELEGMRELIHNLKGSMRISKESDLLNEINRRIEGLESGESSAYGMSDKAAWEILDNIFEVEWEKMTELAKFFKENVTDKTLEMELQSGLISRESYDRIKNAYNFYVPMLTEEVEVRNESAKKVGDAFSGIFHVRGSRSDVARRNPIEAGLAKYNSAAINSERNKAAFALHKMFSTAMVGSSIAEVIPSGEYYNESQKIKDKAVRVKIEGREEFIIIHDENLRKAIKRMTGLDQDMARVLAPLATINNYLRGVFTQYNPAFQIPNYVRDYKQAYYNLPSDVKKNISLPEFTAMSVRTFRGMYDYRQAYSKGKEPTSRIGNLYQRLLEFGGVSRWHETTDVERTRKAVEKAFSIIEDGDVKSMSKRMFELSKKITLDQLDMLGDYFEHANRLAVFNATLKSWMKENRVTNFRDVPEGVYERAAYLAKESTINFDRKGVYGSMMNSLFLFSNAGIQGSARMLHTWKENPKAAAKYSTHIMMAGATMMGLISAMGYGDIYDEEPEWQKMHNVYLPIVVEVGGKKRLVKLPAPYGLGFIPYIGQKGARMIANPQGIENDAPEMLAAFIQSMSEIVNPLGGGFSPTAVQPIVDVARNENFMGLPIRFEDIYTGMDNVLSQSGKVGTGEGYKAVAEYVNKLFGGTKSTKPPIATIMDRAPEDYKHLLESYGGGLYKEFQATMALFDKEEFELDPPIVRRFLSSGSDSYGTRMMYKMYEEAGAKKYDADDISNMLYMASRAIDENIIKPENINNMLKTALDRQAQIWVAEQNDMSLRELSAKDLQAKYRYELMREARRDRKEKNKD